MGKYLILKQRSDPGASHVWQECGPPSEASSGETAIRDYVAKGDKGGGVFLAIPERSAKTIRVKVETVQKVSVDAGKEGD